MPFGGIVVNRMHEEADVDDPAVPDGLDPELAAKLRENFDDFHALALRDRQNVEELTDDLGGKPVIVVPYLDEDVHDLAGLEAMNEHLFAPVGT